MKRKNKNIPLLPKPPEPRTIWEPGILGVEVSKRLSERDAFYKAYKKLLPFWRILFKTKEQNKEWYNKRINV